MDYSSDYMKKYDCGEDTKEEMLQQIMEYKFAAADLALYLDTHPEDKKALYLHNQYCKECKNLTDQYQKVYGPLTSDFPCNRWRWLEQPWPWEKGAYPNV